MNRFFVKTKLVKYAFTACMCSMLAIPSMASAEGFALQDWSARGASLAGGLVTRGGDASTVVYNPAAMTELESNQVMVGSQFVIPSMTFSGTNETTGAAFSTEPEGSVSVVPNAYVAYKLNDTFSLGLALFSRFGSANEFDENWAGRYVVTDVDLFTMTINPVIAWRVNDMLSLAGGIEFSGADVTLKQGARVANNTIEAKAKLEASEMAYAAALNLAAHLRINPQWTVGVTYRSQVDYFFDGELTTSFVHPALGQQSVTKKAKANLNLPQELEVAVGYKVNEKFDLEAMVGFVGWSSYKNLDIKYNDGSATTANPRNWEDTWVFSVSGEYDALDWLTVRGGISHETSPVPAATAEYIAPSNGRWNFATGLGFHKDDWAVDASYTYHMIRDMNYANSVLPGVHNNSTAEVSAHSLGLSVSYNF